MLFAETSGELVAKKGLMTCTTASGNRSSTKVKTLEPLRNPLNHVGLMTLMLCVNSERWEKVHETC
jgi:hypothetical protein